MSNPVGRPRSKAHLKLPDRETYGWTRCKGKALYPTELVMIARRRTVKLLAFIEFTPIQKLIESAYLQGVEDGMLAHETMVGT